MNSIKCIMHTSEELTNSGNGYYLDEWCWIHIFFTHQALLQFISAIIGQSEEECMTFRNTDNETLTSMQKLALEKLPRHNLRQCAVCCNRKTGIKRFNFTCTRCKKKLHGICAGKHGYLKFFCINSCFRLFAIWNIKRNM